MAMDASGACILSFNNALNGEAHVTEALRPLRKLLLEPRPVHGLMDP